MTASPASPEADQGGGGDQLEVTLPASDAGWGFVPAAARWLALNQRPTTGVGIGGTERRLAPGHPALGRTLDAPGVSHRLCAGGEVLTRPLTWPRRLPAVGGEGLRVRATASGGPEGGAEEAWTGRTPSGDPVRAVPIGHNAFVIGTEVDPRPVPAQVQELRPLDVAPVGV